MNIPSRTAVVAGLLAVAGCQPGSQPAPVDPGRARAALKTALESWKNGEPATALEKASPPIYIIDPEWQGGARLIAYEVVSDEEKDAHLFAQVKLTVRGPNGREGTGRSRCSSRARAAARPTTRRSWPPSRRCR